MLPVSRRWLSLRTVFVAFAIQCAAVGAVLIYISWDDFTSSLVSEAWDLAVQRRTSVLQPIGIVAFLIAVFINFCRKGRHEMKAHWVKHLLESFIPAIGAVLLVFTYNLFITVP